MDKENSKRGILWLGILVVIAVILIAWLVGHRHIKNSQTAAKNQSSSSAASNASNPKDIVGYTIPNGWSEVDCQRVNYVVPSTQALPNCSANPDAPFIISLDNQNTTDCNQLANVSNVKKHTCKSTFIDGHKTLVASTTYQDGKTIEDYYINTGKGVVNVQYSYDTTNKYQTEYDQLANGITVKS